MSSTTRTGLELRDDALDHVREAPPGLVRDLEHPFGGHMLDLPRDARGHVGDRADREDAHAHVARDEDFGNGAHPDRVRAEAAQHPQLGGRLEVWTGHRDVDALAEVRVDLVRERAELLGVGPDHVGKPRPELLVVRAAQRIGTHEVDVVVHDHEVAGLEARIEAPRRVRDDERLDSPGAQDTDRECDRLRLIAFVVMEPSVHDGDILALQPADDELARVAGRRASLEAGDLGIRDARGGGDLLGEAAEAAPQDHRDLRRGPRLRANRRDGGANIARAHLGSFRIFSRSSSTKGRVCAVRAKRATGSALRTVILSPFLSSCSSCPSSDRIAGSSCTSSSSSCSGSNTTALPNDRCGAIGTIVIERETGRISGPPTEKPYAVLPVAVATMRPSAQYTMSGSPSTRTAMWIERTRAPRATTTSFRARARARSFWLRITRASSIVRTSTSKRPATMSAIAASNWSRVVAVRKPKRPRFTPSSGTFSGARTRAARRTVPSPPNTQAMSAPAASWVAARPSSGSSTISLP